MAAFVILHPSGGGAGAVYGAIEVLYVRRLIVEALSVRGLQVATGKSRGRQRHGQSSDEYPQGHHPKHGESHL